MAWKCTNILYMSPCAHLSFCLSACVCKDVNYYAIIIYTPQPFKSHILFTISKYEGLRLHAHLKGLSGVAKPRPTQVVP